MLINGLEYNKQEIKQQIKFIKENIKYNRNQLKKWTKALKEEENK